MKNELFFSSKNQNWETPIELFNSLNKEFKFTLDACATLETSKCKKFYSPEMDGLKQNWDGIVWMNPPYGRKIISWIKKAYEESLNGTTIVCLIPSRTDTIYWHKYCMKASEIRFIKGRLKFKNATNAAPFPSSIVIFKNNNNLKINSCNILGEII